MGLDLLAMQAVLDAELSMIVSVDHGLTNMTRRNFLKNFEMHVNALSPRPQVICLLFLQLLQQQQQ